MILEEFCSRAVEMLEANHGLMSEVCEDRSCRSEVNG